MELGAKFFDIFWGDDLLWCHAIIQPYRLFGSAPKVCGGVETDFSVQLWIS